MPPVLKLRGTVVEGLGFCVEGGPPTPACLFQRTATMMNT